MYSLTPFLQRLTAVAVLLLVAVLILTACGGDDESKEDVATPTAASTKRPPTATAVPSQDRPTPTVAPTAVRPTSTPALVTARVSLDEYAKVCSGLSLEGAEAEEEDFTYRDISELFGKHIERFEAVEPPPEFAAWHRAALAYQRAVKKATDDYPAPKDNVVSDEFALEVLIPIALDHQSAIDDAIKGMAPEARDRLIAADCIEDAAPGAVSATAIAIGESKDAVLDQSGEGGRFSFQAQQGERYLIEVAKGTLPGFSITMPFTEARFPERILFSGESESLQATWQAPSSGTYLVQVLASQGGSTGSFSITVRIDPRPDSPANVRYAWEGSATRVNWDAVQGADYYKVYYDDLFDSGCSVDEDGNPSFCEELAARVDGTSFVHTRPDAKQNFYWVVACNSEGCSEIPWDPAPPPEERPTAPTPAATPRSATAPAVTATPDRTSAPADAQRPSAPTNVRYARDGSTIVVSWDAVDEADYYKVYHDDFFDSACSLRSDGTPRFCDELAANVTETTYAHALPDEDENYYWVVACNQGGCSEIDSENPASPANGEVEESGETSGSNADGTGSNAATAPGVDRAALIALYNALDGANWRISWNWLGEEPIGRWYGVTTDRDGHVTELSLSGNELSGEIPAEVGNLSELRVLDLSFNLLNGSIPAELGSLTNLEELLLRGAQGQGEDGKWLSGEIPSELGNLTRLRTLDLSWNTLSGAIPAELGSLGNLEQLYLNSNQLTGPMPAELGNLSALVHLWLNRNDLTGTIPSELGNLERLLILNLNRNQLSGEIPSTLGDLPRLRRLDLSQNQLTGEIPAELGNLSQLQDLHLYNNRLSGAIPAELGKLVNLEELELQSNQLSGTLPAELGDLTNLKVLALNSNQLGGDIPAELGDLANLVVLFLHENELSGAIPQDLGKLDSLKVLALHDNQLSGELWDSFIEDLGSLMAITVCELNQLTCDVGETVIKGIAMGVEAVFGAGGVIGSALGGLGGVLGDIIKSFGGIFGF